MSDIKTDLDAYKFPEVIYYKLKKHYEHEREEAELLVREAKRYVYLAHVNDYPVVPSEEIDHAWHEMILITKSYHDFCNTLCGEYVHHVPSSPEELASESYGESIWEKYRETQKRYEELYGEPCDKRAWTD